MDLGFIEKRTPVTEKNPEKSRKGLYFIADNFIRFWFRYVYPYKGELELDNIQIVIDEMSKDFTTGFLDFVYEDVCKNIYRYSPFLMTTELLLTTHGTNERIPIDTMKSGVAFFKRYIRALTKD